MTFRNRAETLLASLREQTTPRAMLGLGALLLILALWSLGELGSRVNQTRAEVAELERERNLQVALANDDSWIARADEARDSVDRTRSAFWRGDTAGIIVAQLQGEVEAAARVADLTRPRVTVEPAPTPLAGSSVVFELSLSARDPRGQFLALFQELARNPQLLVPTAFSWSRVNGNLEIRLEAPAVVGNDMENNSTGTRS
ncbi:hypothetical protein [Maricaulis sp. CAU 1757]